MDEECLCLYPPMKLLTNSLLNSSKELTDFGSILLNHIRAGPLRVVGKALHIISSRTPWRCIVVLKVAMWLKGSCVPSYESKEGILNFGGKGWPLMEAVKGESVLWTKSSTGFALLIFSLISSMTFLIWSISLSKCVTLREVVPLDWLLGSIFPTPSWLWACPSTYSSCRCLLKLISLVNFWFWRVNFAMAVAMDCICWTEDGCMTGADWQLWWGLLEASLLSWWPGLVALDLVQTIQLFYRRTNRKTILWSSPQTAPTDCSRKISKLDGTDPDELEGLKKK